MLLNCVNHKYRETLRGAMLRDYLNELHKNYNLPPISNYELENPYKAFVLDYPQTMHWYDINDPDTNTPIGFLLTGTGDTCHPDADYYIAETYIKPEFRNKGIGTRFVSEHLKNNPGTYHFYVIKENKGSEKFWKKVFKGEGYQECSLTATPEEDFKHLAFTNKPEGNEQNVN